MHITFAQDRRGRTILQIDDATLCYRNFTGRGDKFNREGDRNFGLRLFDQEHVDALQNDENEFGASWNVKIKPPRNEGDEPFMFLPVKVKFNNRGPKVCLITGNRQNELDEESIECLDDIEIERVDLDIRAYDDEINGKPFRAAYLEKMYVTQRVDRFVERYEM